MVAKAKRELSQTRKLSKFFLPESPSAWKWDAVAAATLPTRQTNGEVHFVRLWKKQLPLKRNLKELKRRC